LTNSIITKT